MRSYDSRANIEAFAEQRMQYSEARNYLNHLQRRENGYELASWIKKLLRTSSEGLILRPVGSDRLMDQ
jgi:hypothetical protein